MTGMTLLSLRTQVTSLVGKGETPPTTGRLFDDINYFANSVLTSIYNAGDWLWKRERATVSSGTNQAYIDLPTDFDTLQTDIIYPTVTTNLSIRLTTDQESFEAQEQANSGRTGQPVLGYIEFDSTSNVYRMRVTPTADAIRAYNLHYNRMAPTLTDNAHTPKMPVDWQSAWLSGVVWWVTMTVHGREAADRLYDAYRVQWRDVLQRANSELARQPRRQNTRIFRNVLNPMGFFPGSNRR